MKFYRHLWDFPFRYCINFALSLKRYTGTHCRSRKPQRFIFAQIYYTYHTYDFNAPYASVWAFFQHNALLDMNLNMKLIDTLSMHFLSHSLKDRNRYHFGKFNIRCCKNVRYTTSTFSYIPTASEFRHRNRSGLYSYFPMNGFDEMLHWQFIGFDVALIARI